jgi:hypothetical protein
VNVTNSHNLGTVGGTVAIFKNSSSSLGISAFSNIDLVLLKMWTGAGQETSDLFNKESLW